MEGPRAEQLLRDADAVFNVAGSTRLAQEGLEVGRLVYLGTDPVYHEITYAQGDPDTRAIVDEHDDVVTYGENIGRDGCRIPPLPGLRARTRQPVLVDLWGDGPPTRSEYTTVGNWRQSGREVEFEGEEYHWSKDREFLQFIDLPQSVPVRFELATNLADADSFRYGEGEAVQAFSADGDIRTTLHERGWNLVDARPLTTDPWTYRDYVRGSRAEFTVARDLNVRLRSGWFSERDASYLAAGRPVVAQDTGFATVLPTGEGLFAFTTLDEAVDAIQRIEADYERHSRAAHEIAREYFEAESVLARLLEDLGL